MYEKFRKSTILLLVFTLLICVCFTGCNKTPDEKIITIWAFDASAEAAKKAVEIYKKEQLAKFEREIAELEAVFEYMSE